MIVDIYWNHYRNRKRYENIHKIERMDSLKIIVLTDYNNVEYLIFEEEFENMEVKFGY